MDGDVSEIVRLLLQPVETFLDYLFYAGVAYAVRNSAGLVHQCWRGFRTYVVPTVCSVVDRRERKLSLQYGKWAVITGGTTPLGLAYAHEFARRNLNVVLISRSYDDLVSTIGELQAKYEDIQTHGIYADFSLGAKVYQDVEEALKEFEIGILVNNVAVRYDHPQYFSLVPHQRMWQLVDVNVTAVTVMTHMCLPQMIQRGRGIIINVASIASCTPPVPLTAEFTATMAYVDSFSRALYYENRRKGVYVQTLLPCAISGPGCRATLFSPSPDKYVRHAMACLGASHRTCGYWPHSLQSWLSNLIPEWLWVTITMYLNTATRTRCIQEAIDKNHPRFSRRSSTFPQGVPAGGRHGSSSRMSAADILPLRRTPSPKRRSISATDGLDSPVMRRKMSSSSGMSGVRKISLDESHGISVTTPEASAAESPVLLSRRLQFMDQGSLKRHKRTSRVLVMPSLATLTHSSADPLTPVPENSQDQAPLNKS